VYLNDVHLEIFENYAFDGHNYGITEGRIGKFVGGIDHKNKYIQ
jgi:hypothetical protein